MKYKTELKTLEPKRWWHSLGIKRKFVNFKITFKINNYNSFQIKTKENAITKIKDISTKRVDDYGKLISNDDFNIDTNWSINENEAL
jgi:CRISPR/Cas system CMR-associated protein Cmr3 (group 5 of RAMP superfamily)